MDYSSVRGRKSFILMPLTPLHYPECISCSLVGQFWVIQVSLSGFYFDISVIGHNNTPPHPAALWFTAYCLTLPPFGVSV